MPFRKDQSKILAGFTEDSQPPMYDALAEARKKREQYQPKPSNKGNTGSILTGVIILLSTLLFFPDWHAVWRYPALTTGTVLGGTNTVRSGKNAGRYYILSKIVATFSVDGYNYTAEGERNMTHQIGDSVPVRYVRSSPANNYIVSSDNPFKETLVGLCVVTAFGLLFIILGIYGFVARNKVPLVPPHPKY